jgi:two-component system, NtrC family, sensor kinase
MSAIPDSTLADPKDHLIADLQQQLAECRAERDEALEQQTATAEVLQVINSSPGDLAPVFEAMLEKATRLCEAPYGLLRIWDGEYFQYGAVHGDSRFSDWVRRRGPFRPDSDDNPLRRILEGERVIQFADARDSTSPGFRQMVEASGIRSGAMVALHKDEALLGTITIYHREVRPFSDKQIALLQNFAAQAVIAMENAHLITETREALERQTATAEVLQVINSSPGDLAPVFDAMLEKALRLCDAAVGQLLRFDRERFHILAARHAGSTEVKFSYEPIVPDKGSTLERMAKGESLVHIPDIIDTEAYHSGVASRLRLVKETGARTALWVALRKEEDLLGIFVVYRQEVRLFTDKQIALLQNFAAQAVIAMENARLLTETREALEQQTATAEVLQVINSSPGDLAPVFDAMLEKAMRLCGAAFGQLATYDGEHLRTAATRGLPAAFAEYRRNNPPPYGPGTTPARILEGERVIRTDDLKAEPVYQSGESNRRALVDLGGARSEAIVALRQEESILGFIEPAFLG